MKATAELKAADRNPYSGNILWTQEILTATADTERKEVNDMIKTTMKIDGMMCGMCEAHICDTKESLCFPKKKGSHLPDGDCGRCCRPEGGNRRDRIYLSRY